MATSLYISNERLMAVTGSASNRRIAVKAYSEAALPTGSVINGVITDEAAFAETVRQLAGQFGRAFNNVHIVLNASRIYIKRVVLPKLKKTKLMELVAEEFSDIDTEADDELIYDCMPLSDQGSVNGSPLLVCAAKRSLVASYAELFDGLKIRLAGMDTAQSALIKLTGMLEGIKGETYITLGLDGETIDASLFVNGEYRHNNRVRLAAPRGTAESTAEISRMVSSLIQFNSSENKGMTVSGVYAVGLKPGEQALLTSLSTAYGMPALGLKDAGGLVSVPDDNFALDQYAYAVGNLIGV